MSENEHDEIQSEGEPKEAHVVEDALDEDDDTREKAQAGEEIVAEEELSPKKRAKLLRKLPDEELLALGEQADKADHWLDIAKRTQAELDNTVKRIRREYEERLKYATSPIASDLLPIIDNLGRALAAGLKNESFKGLYDGVNMTSKMFMDTLARHGIEPIKAEGQPFDPAFHEAMMTDNRDDVDDNVITAELEKGWKMGGRVLRASKVKVNEKS